MATVKGAVGSGFALDSTARAPCGEDGREHQERDDQP